MIEAVRAENVTVHATNRDNSLIWLGAETWPVNMSLGEHIEAPGIDFLRLDGGGQVAFCARAFDTTDTSEVALTGSEAPDGPIVQVGVIPANLRPPTAVSFPIAVGSATSLSECTTSEGSQVVPLRLSNAWLSGVTSSIFVGPGTDLSLGPNPVWIGSRGTPGIGPTGFVGIECLGELANPSSIRDVGSSVVHIGSQSTDLQIDAYCSVSLVHGPTFGIAPDGGVGTCPGVVSDGEGLTVGPYSFVELGSAQEPATIQCQQYNGIEIQPDTPSVVIFQGLMRNIICYGAQVHGGVVSIVGSQFVDDGIGVWVAPGGTVNLSGMDMEELQLQVHPSDLSCTTPLETEQSNTLPVCQDDSGAAGAYGPTGAALINTSGTTVNAENVRWHWWDPDAGMPQVWSCSDPVHFSFSTCICHGPDCPAEDAGLPYRIPAMYSEGNPNPFDFADGGLSTEPCQTCSYVDAGVVVCVPP